MTETSTFNSERTEGTEGTEGQRLQRVGPPLLISCPFTSSETEAFSKFLHSPQLIFHQPGHTVDGHRTDTLIRTRQLNVQVMTQQANHVLVHYEDRSSCALSNRVELTGVDPLLTIPH